MSDKGGHGYVGMDIGGIAGWLASLATGAILLTALFNASKGSILALALFHAAIREFYEMHSDSVELWTPGSPTFPDLEIYRRWFA